MKELPTFTEITKNPKSAYIPKDACGKYRVCQILMKKIDKKRLKRCLVYLGRMPSLYVAFVGCDFYKKFGHKVTNSQEWISIFTKHRKFFSC